MVDLLSGLVVSVTREKVGTQVATQLGTPSPAESLPLTGPGTLGGGGGSSLVGGGGLLLLALTPALAAPTGTSVLVLDDTSVFNSTGGQVTIDGGDPITYVSVDDDASTMTLAGTLSAGVAEGATVLVYPELVTMTALVLVDGESDPIPAAVPHNWHDVLPPGIREEPDREEVRLTRDGDWSWAVFDVTSGPLVRLSPLRLVGRDGYLAGGVDENGNVIGGDLSYSGAFSGFSDSAFFDGTSFGNWLSLLPRGVQVYGNPTPQVSGITTDEYGLFEVAWTPPDDYAIRQYRYHFSASANADTADTPMGLRLRYTVDGSKPDALSPQLAVVRGTIRSPAIPGTTTITRERMWRPETGATHRFLVTMAVEGSEPGQLTTRHTADFWIDDLGLYQGDASGTNKAGGPLAPGGVDATPAFARTAQTYQKTFNAIDGRYWGGDGVLQGAGDSLGFGNDPHVTNGNRKAAVWFDRAAISAAINDPGTTVTKVELYLYLDDGGRDNTVTIGSHTDIAPSNDYNAISTKIVDRTRSPNWNEGDPRWVSLTWDLQGWKNAYGGVLVGPGPTNSDVYAGRFRGATSTQRPRLRITFTR